LVSCHDHLLERAVNKGKMPKLAFREEWNRLSPEPWCPRENGENAESVNRNYHSSIQKTQRSAEQGRFLMPVVATDIIRSQNGSVIAMSLEIG
jgi:hypothetical protein